MDKTKTHLLRKLAGQIVLAKYGIETASLHLRHSSIAITDKVYTKAHTLREYSKRMESL